MLTLLLLIALNPLENTRPQVIDMDHLFGPVDGTFVVLELKTGRLLRHNPERAAQRFSPCSTFKIPNSLIALETGVAQDEHHRIAWDREKYPPKGFFPKPWRRDHRLETAIRHSVVWYYRELALAIGEPRMNEALARMDYGNRDTSGGLDRFWLDGSLQISADEQVAFLEKFYKEELGFSWRATRIVKHILVLEHGANYRLSAKTGSNGTGLGWLVGYVEKGDEVWLFALNGQWPDGEGVYGKRLPLAKSILGELGILP